MSVFRASVLIAAGALRVMAQSQPPEETDKALRTAIARFYTLLVEKKFRAAEELVAVDSRDDYYVGEKPSILDFKIDAIHWGPGFEQADVSMASRTRVRRAILGEFEVTVPYLSHWVLEHGSWYWIVPKVDRRLTPFGPMAVSPKAASDAPHAEMDLKKMIAEGPKPTDFANGIHVSGTRIESTGDQKITLENTLGLAVTCKTERVDGKGFTGKLDPETLPPHGTGTLKIIRGEDSFVHGRLLATCEQTGQAILIDVQ